MKIFMDPELVHLTGHSKQLLVKVLIWKAQVRNKTSAFCSHDSWYTSESLMLIISAYACMAMCSSSRSSITPYPPATIKTWPLFHGLTINPEAAKMASRLPRWPKHSWNGQRLSGSCSSDFFHTDRQSALIRLVAWFISQPWNKFLDEVTSDPALTANRNGGPRQHRLGMVKLRTTSIRKGIQ